MPICRIFNSNGNELVHFLPSSKSEKHHWVVGRSSSCDVSLKGMAETSVSRRHFTLDYTGGAWHIHDTSRAGLVYNGEHITEMKLENGMVLRFGQLIFGFGDRAVPSRYRLSWGWGGTSQGGALWKGINEIGSSHDNTVMIREGDVARKHCLIRITDENEIYLANASSLVNTEINGVQLKGTNETLITVDDRISLAGYDVEIVLGNPDTYKGENILSEEELKIRNRNAPLQRQVKVLNIVIATMLIITIIICVSLLLTSLMPKT